MKKLFTQSSKIAALGAIAFIAAMAVQPAYAQPGHPMGRPGPVHDRDWDRHEHVAHDWRLHHPHPSGVVYAPPAVVYAPPPQPSGINLIIPFDIR